MIRSFVENHHRSLLRAALYQSPSLSSRMKLPLLLGLLLAWGGYAACARAFVDPWGPSTRAQGPSVGPSVGPFLLASTCVRGRTIVLSSFSSAHERSFGLITGGKQPDPHHLLQQQQHGPLLPIYGSTVLRVATDGGPDDQGARRRGRLPPSAYRVVVSRRVGVNAWIYTAPSLSSAWCRLIPRLRSPPAPSIDFSPCANAESHDRRLYFL